ncbi:alpha/beta hydrolase fold domain-containing protein [Kocuria arenosa]|uniref:alpha/beta hydrolase fold domain-containing protein n=1 Tax=Kocuria arenosa TaxID=3071446 RepID=UPI0034D5663D
MWPWAWPHPKRQSPHRRHRRPQKTAGYTAVTTLSNAKLPGNVGTVDLYLPENAEGPVPVVLWTAGSAWLADSGNREGEHVARLLTEHGYAVAAVAVRSSSQALFSAQIHDAKAAVRWLRVHAEQYNLDGECIAAMGNSSGGWTSTMLGVTSNDPTSRARSGLPGLPVRCRRSWISTGPPTSCRWTSTCCPERASRSSP